MRSSALGPLESFTNPGPSAKITLKLHTVASSESPHGIDRLRNACNSWERVERGLVGPEPRRISTGTARPGRSDLRGRDCGPAPRMEIADQRQNAPK
ncbi:hypothetical protein NDU88_000196 [Pleurodeles waltl]|uniref:Uncharacterized protein n=1 Tax=Pleurodeles waltl TaxID=8319 RepID=A0AAV7V4F4_PLEWA|nr:hypothetical protein NDU88_000196 [Pleurodeles waltl]